MKLMSCLLIAAGAFSSFGWAKTARQKIVVVSGMQQEGAIAKGPGVISVLSGGKITTLLQRLSQIDPHTVRAVLSFGVAGGLDPRLDAGSVALATKVIDDNGTIYMTSPKLVSEITRKLDNDGIQYLVGSWVGSNIERRKAEDKEALGKKTGAIAVDMESQGAAAWATANGIPFAVLRTISDRVDFTLPPLTDTAVNADGSYDLSAIFDALLQDPSQLGGLLQTGIDAFAAFSELQFCRDTLKLGSL